MDNQTPLRSSRPVSATCATQIWVIPTGNDNVLVSNVDDHLKNHGFLYTGDNGWLLSPAYDLNPVPTDLKPRILCTAIDLDDSTASIDLAFSVAGYFSVKPDEAKTIAAPT